MSGYRKHFVQLGQRFGRGVVIDSEVKVKYPSSRYPVHGARLLCDCGREYDSPLYALYKGATVSCGCKKFETWKDLTGLRFGMLTVIGRAPNRKGNIHWLCQCDCGQKKAVDSHGMKSGIVKSCGCLRNPPIPGSARRQILRTYKRAAKIRNLGWELTDEDFDSLTSAVCEYCDSPPSKVSQSKSGEIFIWNGIDRVDNSLGYAQGNVVTCCTQCNIAKRDYTLDEFKAWIERLALKNGFVRAEALNENL